jgi:hypothetical protein
MVPLILTFLISASSFAATPPSPAPEKFSPFSSLESVESRYTQALCQLAQNWPRGVSFNGAPPSVGRPTLESECYETEGNPTYIGIGQRMVIGASIARVSAVVDDFAGYVGIFDGLVSVHPVATDGNRLVTEWEESIPFPFVPNEHSQMVHLINQRGPALRTYRYGLKKGTDLLKDDGIVVLEAKSPDETIYTEYDFFDANWGIAKSFGVDRLWKRNVEGIYQSDLALKLRAEHPDWLSKKVLSESSTQADALLAKKDACPKRKFIPPTVEGISKCQ